VVAADALRVLAARGVRAFGDGFVALLLPIYLVERGFSALAIGAIVTGTLIGTALMTLWVGRIANRHSRRLLLLAAAGLMAATGVGFAALTDFWPLLVIAVVGTMNPTSGDASIFVPLEQTVLAQTIEPRRRTALFARYSVIGSCATALGVLAAAFPDFAAAWIGCSRAAAMRLMFAFYAVLGLATFLLYRPLSPAIEIADAAAKAPLRRSRRRSRRVICAALFIWVGSKARRALPPGLHGLSPTRRSAAFADGDPAPG
jgi:MFS family permease